MITRHKTVAGTYFVEARGSGFAIKRHGELYPTYIVGEEQTGYWWAGRSAPVTQFQRKLIELHLTQFVH